VNDGLVSLHRQGGRGAPTAAPVPVLRLGASGPAVKELQNQLNELGESLLASGQYGPRTAEAVRRFQVAKGIQPASGIVDAATRKVLDELKNAGNPRTIPRARPAAEWFSSAAQSPSLALEASPESVLLLLMDGRQVTVEQAFAMMNATFEKSRGGVPRDPDDPRDVDVGAVLREWQKANRKGYLTMEDRQRVGAALKIAFGSLGEVDIISIGSEGRQPAVRVLE
jgi:hypothetical protein